MLFKNKCRNSSCIHHPWPLIHASRLLISAECLAAFKPALTVDHGYILTNLGGPCSRWVLASCSWHCSRLSVGPSCVSVILTPNSLVYDWQEGNSHDVCLCIRLLEHHAPDSLYGLQDSEGDRPPRECCMPLFPRLLSCHPACLSSDITAGLKPPAHLVHPSHPAPSPPTDLRWRGEEVNTHLWGTILTQTDLINQSTPLLVLRQDRLLWWSSSDLLIACRDLRVPIRMVAASKWQHPLLK